MSISEHALYTERVSSSRTGALFLALTIIFALPAFWRVTAGNLDAVAVLFFCLSGFFLFYSLNYRTLVIRLTSEALTLTFGIFIWVVSLEEIADFRLDDMPLLMRLGGAGIHFMLIGGRYRALFNFLEYPRVTIGFRKPRGPVRDLTFSTRGPHEILRLIGEAVSVNRAR
jgi:hypothetical protein